MIPLKFPEQPLNGPHHEIMSATGPRSVCLMCLLVYLSADSLLAVPELAIS